PVAVERVSCDVCVIGAGESGLACARVVAASGATVIVLEEEEIAAPSWVRVRTSAVGVFDETNGTRLVLGVGDRGAIAIAPKVLVIAQGRAESAEAFEGNDLPGVISLAAAERLFASGVLPGEKPVIASESARGEALAHRFEAAGVVATRIAVSD